MAFKDVGSFQKTEKYIKATEMKIGDVVEGYITSIVESKKKPGAYTIYMLINDENVGFNVAGNIKYRILDGDIQEGFLTRFTRVPDAKTKGGGVRSNFRIQQDKDKPTDLAKMPARASKAEQKRDNLAQKAKILAEEQ